MSCSNVQKKKSITIYYKRHIQVDNRQREREREKSAESNE